MLTNYIGELIQHDSSHHRWSPYAPEKWHLITSLDDFSRKLLYAELVEKETSWDHISALESVILGNGVPYAYYTDSHSIFRFVQGRDSIWRKHYLVTDDVDPQWKRVIRECRIDPRYALFPLRLSRPRISSACSPRESSTPIGKSPSITYNLSSPESRCGIPSSSVSCPIRIGNCRNPILA